MNRCRAARPQPRSLDAPDARESGERAKGGRGGPASRLSLGCGIGRRRLSVVADMLNRSAARRSGHPSSTTQRGQLWTAGRGEQTVSVRREDIRLRSGS